VTSNTNSIETSVGPLVAERDVSAEPSLVNDEEVRIPKHRRLRGLPPISRYSGIYLILAMLGIFALTVPGTFFTAATLKSLLSQYSITTIATLGVLFTLAVACYDLTIGAVLGFAAILSAWLTGPEHMNVAVALAITVGVCLVLGAVNGFLVVVVGIDSFIATLGMSAVIAAFTIKVSGNSYITGIPHSFESLTTASPFGIPVIAIYATVFAVVAWYALEHTPMGRRMYATGFDREASRLAGVATNKLRFNAFLVTATVAGIAGILLTSQYQSADPTQGANYLLPVFAGALLGATQVKPGRVNVAGAIVAIALLAVGIEGLQLIGASLWVTQLFNGAALVVAVGASELSKRRNLSVRGWLQARRGAQSIPDAPSQSQPHGS
jgi:ribose transport system permease protein